MTDRKLQLEEWLDDLCVRFILNVPAADLEHVPRICFQIEEAHWYYEDFIRPLDSSLPSMTLPFQEFMDYKGRVPVRGVILLNAEMDSVVLVKGWKKGANWSFPRGKINKDEDDLTCAIREAFEETGYDVERSGLVAQDRSLVEGLDVTGHGQQIRLYPFRDVPMDTLFEPQTRKEISRIQWWRLSDLPGYNKKGQQQHQPEAAANANKFYMVAPFLPKLKKWIFNQKREDTKMAAKNWHLEAAGNISYDEAITEDDQPVEPRTTYNTSTSREAERTRRDAADLALSALMQVQPPTQGLQPNTIKPAQSQTSHSSGQQLLALLHSKPPVDQSTVTQPSLQKPSDQTIPQPSLPKTPHYQPPHPSHGSNQPPNFPQQQPHEQRPMQTYSYQQPDFHSIQQQPLHHNFPVSGAMPLPQFQNVHATMVAPQQKEAPAALTSHSLLLLNAFKTRDQVNGNSTSSHLSSQGPTQSHVKASLPEAQELPGESSRSIPVPFPIDAVESSKVVPGLNPGTSGTISHNQRAPPSVSEHQRSMLLGMFKSPAAQPATLAAGPAAVDLPTSGSPSVVELSAVEVISPPPISQQRSTNGDAAISQASPENTEMNPELNLPFRAKSILTRPENGHKDIKPYGSLSKKSANRSEMQNSSKISSKTSPERSFQPQILKRPQANTVKASPLLAPSTIAAYSPSLAPSNIAGFSTSPLSFTSQAPQSTEQKHALLSLFGKSPMAASSSISRASSHDGTSSNPLVDATRSAASRSRVGSLASGNDEGMSRRGSQTPISSADKGFLLNYLDAVANRGY
ncbi:hypothetical protein DID88_001499 [Monilinia fructigena]|uniref:Nudix hydrolase domain-containing protein n=1 Tax=Monilinia fructigena TaxID=38457 RepID=A0A395IXA1_9HELO|nr:hypothetical protein DID88_001499 [Monilinia fructigena]